MWPQAAFPVFRFAAPQVQWSIHDDFMTMALTPIDHE
jgi:hypothetical protein